MSSAVRRLMAHSQPKVSSITPASGSSAGGTAITDVAGANFVIGCKVSFVSASGLEVLATSVVRVSPAKVTCVTPAMTAGPRLMILRNPDGEVATGYFTFV